MLTPIYFAANGFNSPKVHRREDQLATVHIKPYTSSFLLRSCRGVYHLLRQRLRPFTHLPPRLFSPACFLPQGYFFNRPCDKQMGTKFWEALCDEHGIGGSGEYCGGNDAYLGRNSNSNSNSNSN
jgi:hypothetical protein